MPQLKRRSFLKLIGVTGLAPVVPTLPAQAAVTKSGVSASKALWSGIYVNSGSAAGFVSTAKSMGLSNAAIRGISARSIQSRFALSVGKVVTRSRRSSLPGREKLLDLRHRITEDLKSHFSDKSENIVAQTETAYSDDENINLEVDDTDKNQK